MDRKKIIPKNIKRDLSPLALSVWIMDDGSHSRGRIDISTYCFSLEEIIFLQGCFKEIYDIKINFFKDRDKGYRMYCNLFDTKKLISVIKPYIIPSMSYKIGL